jgi:hypothetical protein
MFKLVTQETWNSLRMIIILLMQQLVRPVPLAGLLL